MPSILLTAFEPYDEWKENASWLVLKEITSDLPTSFDVTTRLYPVDFAELKRRLGDDLRTDFDFAIHLGQAPGQSSIAFEAIGLNLALDRGQDASQVRPLAVDGPAAFLTALPIGDWASALREMGVPACVSHHAGTYLCNAALYLSYYFAETTKLKTRAAFLHIPIDPSQAISAGRDLPTMPVKTTAAAVRWIVEQL